MPFNSGDEYVPFDSLGYVPFKIGAGYVTLDSLEYVPFEIGAGYVPLSSLGLVPFNPFPEKKANIWSLDFQLFIFQLFQHQV